MRLAMMTAMLMATVSPCFAAPLPDPIEKDTNPTVFLGMTVALGSSDVSKQVGFTARALSSNAEDEAVFGGGISYYPWSDNKIGLDLGVGYNFTNFGVFGGYDILRRMPTVSAGYVPTVNDEPFCPEGLTLEEGSCYLPEESDRRLKSAIMHLATMPNGIRIYSFRYVWSEQVHVGVMAQDLLHHPTFGAAIKLAADGYYRVNYALLGLRMVTIQEWKRNGLAAVSLQPVAMAA
jgi:hypothetical protein